MVHTDLDVFKKSNQLLKLVYTYSKTLPPEERYELGQDLRKTVRSIPVNIAEGAGRSTPGDFRRFLDIAQGSLAELDAHLLACEILDYNPPTKEIKSLLVDVRKMLYRLKKAL